MGKDTFCLQGISREAARLGVADRQALLQGFTRTPRGSCTRDAHRPWVLADSAARSGKLHRECK